METAAQILHENNSLTAMIGGKRDYINMQRMHEPKQGVLFTDFITQTAFRKSKRMGKSYLKNYITLVNHIKKFCAIYNASVYTNSVNDEFIDDFIVYLESLELRKGYIKNIISLIVAMATKAGKYGYAVDPTFDDVVYDGEDSFSVYLSMNEITRMYYFQGLTKKQEKIRDLFIVGCLTALRYSDYSKLTSANFVGDFIYKTSQKTNIKTIIPLHTYVREIYSKYNGNISDNLSIQHFNRYIKLIAQKVGFDENVTCTYTKGRKVITETKPKWQYISSHTARRSAATNMYLTGRMKTFEIMAITGHNTEKSFFKYIKVTKEDISKQISGDNYFNK